MKHVIAVAHGTDSPDGRATIDAIRESLAQQLEAEDAGEFQVHEAYVDVQEPSLDAVAAKFSEEDEVIMVPLLLSTGYHTQVDMKKAADASPARDVRIARALGPSAQLAKLQRTRLEEAGWDGSGQIVMAAAGSSRADGRQAVELQSEIFSTLLSQHAPHGFVASIDPKIADVVEEHSAEFVSTYLMGRGFFQGLLHKLDGAGKGLIVAEPLVIPGDEDSASVVASVAKERVLEADASYRICSH
ncbi:sirohydrochlorin chelatase [Rothia terrae]|uniref:sirohydrochlorin chelatase n=1 Tax=Rothia terrae TaxID=396015 RepID=UPI00340F5CBE